MLIWQATDIIVFFNDTEFQLCNFLLNDIHFYKFWALQFVTYSLRRSIKIKRRRGLFGHTPEVTSQEWLLAVKR